VSYFSENGKYCPPEAHTHTHTHTYIYIYIYILRYKLAGRGFDSRLCHWNLSVT